MLVEPGLKNPDEYKRSVFADKGILQTINSAHVTELDEAEEKWMDSQRHELEQWAEEKIAELAREMKARTEEELARIHAEYEAKRQLELEEEARRRMEEWAAKRLAVA